MQSRDGGLALSGVPQDECGTRGRQAVPLHLAQLDRDVGAGLVPAPVHASWLNPIEIYFSIVQRKVLTPIDFSDLNAVAEHLLDFQYYWETTARPFQWKFTRQDLTALLVKLGTPHPKIR